MNKLLLPLPLMIACFCGGCARPKSEYELINVNRTYSFCSNSDKSYVIDIVRRKYMECHHSILTMTVPGTANFRTDVSTIVHEKDSPDGSKAFLAEYIGSHIYLLSTYIKDGNSECKTRVTSYVAWSTLEHQMKIIEGWVKGTASGCKLEPL